MEPAASLWPEAAYRFDLSLSSPDGRAGVACGVFRRVWRTTLDEPGFAVIRLGAAVGSLELRRVMHGLVAAFPVRFVPERLGRFDQQVTSRFHRDGAPAASLLLLGYEASPVRSRLSVADAHRAAERTGLEIAAFLAAFNPMFPNGAARLGGCVTNLVVPQGEPFVVAINNSLLPLVPGGENPLGLLHKAEVPNPDPGATRVINSMGLVRRDDPTGTPKGPDAVEHFLTRDDLD